MTAPPGEILLVRLSAIGDVVHTLPVSAALKRRGFRVTWIVEPAARPLLEGNPAIAQVVAAPPARAWRLGAVRAAVTELRRTHRDAALDLQGLWKSAAWALSKGRAALLKVRRVAVARVWPAGRVRSSRHSRLSGSRGLRGERFACRRACRNFLRVIPTLFTAVHPRLSRAFFLAPCSSDMA